MKCGICHQETNLWEDNGVLCEECSQKPRYRYYALFRPVGYACIPDGWCLREPWSPMRHVDSWYVHGWVEYPEPLPMERIWKFDFIPANETEQKQYFQWHEENRR